MIQDPDAKVGRVFLRLTDLPSLPEVVRRILALSDVQATTRQFADLIATDQGLAAKVLRLVNSAFYSLRSPISSVRQASSLLGVRTLKSLALSVSAIHLFKRHLPCFDPIRFWRHALAVALAAPKIAQSRALACLDEVYVAGLLHDIGIALCMQHYPQEYARVARPRLEGTPEGLALEVKEFGQSHQELGYNMAIQWRLHPLIALGLRYHHSALKDLPSDLEPQARGLIQAVQLADVHARRSGYSFAEADELDPALPPPAGLEMSSEQVQAVVGDLVKTIEELETLYLGDEKDSSPVGKGSPSRPEPA